MMSAHSRSLQSVQAGVQASLACLARSSLLGRARKEVAAKVEDELRPCDRLGYVGKTIVYWVYIWRMENKMETTVG